MKNLSIRSRILSGVVIVNLLGALAVVVYLHQAYTGDLDTIAVQAASQGVAAWEQLGGLAVDPTAQPQEAADILVAMKAITGVDYGVMIDKATTDSESFSAAREVIGLPNNWDEREAYALLTATDDAQAEHMQFALSADAVPEMGKAIGIENGACSQMCHEAIGGDGDYWMVRWSQDDTTRAHGVFPIADPSGEVVGIVYAIDDISRQANDARSSMLQTLAVIGVTLVVATLFIGGLIDALVFKRLRRMMGSIEEISLRLAGGDFDAHFEPDGTNDEIGAFEAFFADFVDLISRTLRSLISK